jgi:hypothetical protein
MLELLMMMLVVVVVMVMQLFGAVIFSVVNYLL